MNIKKAQEKDYSKIKNFYYSLIDAMSDSEYKPGWEKDIYPSQEFLLSSIKNKELYYVDTASEIKACMVVNSMYNSGYQSVEWSVSAEDNELLVIHALGVHPKFAGQGIAKQMVQSVFEMAKKKNIKSIRLDVLEGNVPAEQVYLKMGFQYVTTIEMFYEDTGWTKFKMFEYLPGSFFE